MTEETFRPEARAPRGFADKRAPQLRSERAILEAVSKVYESYGLSYGVGVILHHPQNDNHLIQRQDFVVYRMLFVLTRIPYEVLKID